MAKKIMTPIDTKDMTQEQLIKFDQQNRNKEMKDLRASGNTKSAAEAAYWMEKLLTEQEAVVRAFLSGTKVQAQIEEFVLKTRPAAAKKAKEKAEAQAAVEARAYLDRVKKEVKPFTSKDMADEVARRRMENYEAAKQLSFPAMKAATNWGDCSIFEASQIVHGNPAEMGCKALFQHIAYRNDAITELEDKMAGLENEQKAAVIRRDELVTDSQNAHRAGNFNEFAKILTLIQEEKATIRKCTMERHTLMRKVKDIKTERRVLIRTLKKIKAMATPTELMLIKAQNKVFVKKARLKKEVPVGRPVIECQKPALKGYKLMNFRANSFVMQFDSLISKLNNEGIKCFNVQMDESSTDDERIKAKQKLRKVYAEVAEKLRSERDGGTFIELDEKNARIHNARQSYLSDIIGVPYGKTTDMVITFGHGIANVFNNVVETNLDDDPKEGQRMLRNLMAIILDMATVNGIHLTVNRGEKSRVLTYKFWNANNSKLKVGEGTALSEAAYERAAEVGRLGMTDEEYGEMWTNGSDMLKYWSYASTPGCPLMYNGEPVTCNDVLVVDSIETLRWFRNVLEFDEEGNEILHDKYQIPRTAYDGQMFFLVPIPSQQIRGAMCFKGFGINCAHEDGTTMIDEIAAREGLDIPEYIKDVDGNMKRWRDYKIVCTKDAWKFAGWKFGEEETRLSYAEYCDRMNKLAKKYPTANMIYTARIADATEESKRRLTRQSIQQFIFSTRIQLEKLYAKSLGKLRKWNTHDGILRALAGLDKEDDQRTPFEHLIEVCPEILDNPLMKRFIEDLFNRKVAEAAVRPEVCGIYPYIGEDPVAFFKIVFWGKNPNETSLGYLKSSQMNAPCTEEGKEAYLVRYPNNYLCGRCRTNHNDDIYRDVGNVLILSLDGGILIIADGDTDGDEFCVIFDEVVIEMMRDTLHNVKPPIVYFPHPKMKKRIIRNAKERCHEMSMAMVIANIFGPAVGQNSNLATKFMNLAAINYALSEAGDKKKYYVYRCQLNNAIVAHVAAIIAIDLAKTGEMPDWLKTKLSEIEKFAGKKMPWNQRFCKDSKASP